MYMYFSFANFCENIYVRDVNRAASGNDYCFLESSWLDYNLENHDCTRGLIRGLWGTKVFPPFSAWQVLNKLITVIREGERKLIKSLEWFSNGNLDVQLTCLLVEVSKLLLFYTFSPKFQNDHNVSAAIKATLIEIFAVPFWMSTDHKVHCVDQDLYPCDAKWLDITLKSVTVLFTGEPGNFKFRRCGPWRHDVWSVFSTVSSEPRAPAAVAITKFVFVDHLMRIKVSNVICVDHWQ